MGWPGHRIVRRGIEVTSELTLEQTVESIKMSVLPQPLATFLCELDVVFTGFAERCHFLRRGCLRIEDLNEVRSEQIEKAKTDEPW